MTANAEAGRGRAVFALGNERVSNSPAPFLSRHLGDYLLVAQLSEDSLGTVFRALYAADERRFVRLRVLQSAELVARRRSRGRSRRTRSAAGDGRTTPSSRGRSSTTSRASRS